MKKYEGKHWRDISVEDREMLLKNAVCREGSVGLSLTDGSGLVHFSETLTARGTIHNGVINIDDDAILYNPCIRKKGETMSQEELDAQFDEYVEKNAGSRNDEFIKHSKNTKKILNYSVTKEV